MEICPTRQQHRAENDFEFWLGEDASFDVELCGLYKCNFVICDPTPRAILHFAQISANFGKTKSIDYSKTGKQQISSYQLKELDSALLEFFPVAIRNQSGSIRLHFPLDPESVSLSINSTSRLRKQSQQIFDKKCVTVTELIESFEMKEIKLVKMDIEGAELEVLDDMFENQIQPRQILIEFDWLLSVKPGMIVKYVRVQLLLWAPAIDIPHTAGLAI